MHSYPFFETIISMYGENLLWYAGFAFPFFLIFWIAGKKFFKQIRIQETEQSGIHHFKHDLGFSACTFLVFATMDAIFLKLEHIGYTKIYFNLTDYGYWWAGLSFLLVLFIDDLFFYWSHRAMHHPRLYRFFHKVHHESTDPSPLTAFAFHPSEAIIENLMHFILPFLLPINLWILIAWQIFSMLNNVVGHLGYELYPQGWVRLPILKYKTASTHHNMHHQLFNGNYALYFTWWDKWMGTEFPDYEARHAAIFERKNIKKTADGFYSLAVAEIQKEANEAFSIVFKEVPLPFQSFAAGKHVTIKVMIGGLPYYRTFSISSIPNTGTNMTLTIKRIKGGKVTNHLAEHLRPGDTLDVSEPQGQFFIMPEPSHQKHYILIAGGSGITPLHSMAGSILTLEPKSKITLLYANKNSRRILFREKLNEWKKTYPDQLDIKHYLSEAGDECSDAGKGPITRATIEELLNKSKYENPEFYLCGPELMTNKLLEDLNYLGVKKDKIHRELFVIQAEHKEIPACEAHVVAHVFDKSYPFEAEANKTILESAIDHHIPLPFSCKSGLCGMCKMKCTKGKVKMNNNQVLTEEEIASGYILTCQAIAESKEITIQKM